MVYGHPKIICKIFCLCLFFWDESPDLSSELSLKVVYKHHPSPTRFKNNCNDELQGWSSADRCDGGGVDLWWHWANCSPNLRQDCECQDYCREEQGLKLGVLDPQLSGPPEEGFNQIDLGHDDIDPYGRPM